MKKKMKLDFVLKLMRRIDNTVLLKIPKIVKVYPIQTFRAILKLPLKEH